MKILNDVEHRIFLAAMEREERVCKKVESEHHDPTNGVDLMMICRSIVQKVSKAVPSEDQVDRNQPLMVNYEGDGYADGEIVYDVAKCPTCGYYFEDGAETWEAHYCPRCGQRLKWKENEE